MVAVAVASRKKKEKKKEGVDQHTLIDQILELWLSLLIPRC